MATVLCLDTEPETVAAIAGQGHRVATGSLGYRDGVLDQPHAPHDYEAVVCDLRRPACCRSDGPDEGEPGEPAIVTRPGEAYRRQRGRLLPTYRLVDRARMVGAAGTGFAGRDVLDAVRDAGTQVFLFLNPEWIRHLHREFPDWTGIAWKFQATVANRIAWSPFARHLLPELEALSLPSAPIRFSIEAGPVESRMGETGWSFLDRLPSLTTRTLATNALSRCLGQVVQARAHDLGKIWALPPLPDNAKAANLLLARLNSLRGASPVGAGR